MYIISILIFNGAACARQPSHSCLCLGKSILAPSSATGLCCPCLSLLSHNVLSDVKPSPPSLLGHKATIRFIKTFLSTKGTPSQAPCYFKISDGLFRSWTHPPSHSMAQGFCHSSVPIMNNVPYPGKNSYDQTSKHHTKKAKKVHLIAN